MTVRWASPLAVASLLLISCKFDSTLPVPGLVLCAADEECPQGYVCALDIGKCRLNVAGDLTPPKLSATLDADVVRRGATLHLHVTTSELLGAPPELHAEGPSGTLPFTLVTTADDGLSFEYTRTVQEEADGFWAAVGAATDTSGNRAAGVDLAARFQVDTRRPSSSPAPAE